MMTAFVWNLLLTAFVAALLATACRSNYLTCRPALRHTLWLLVLVKLITPPLIPVPILPPLEASAAPHSPITTSPLVTQPVRVDPGFIREANLAHNEVSETVPSDGTVVALSNNASSAVFLEGLWTNSLGHVLAATSLLVTLVLLTVHTARALRLNKWITRFGQPNEKLQSHCREVAERLGIKRRVIGRGIDARIVPLLWGWRNVTVVVPLRLLDELDGESLQSIVAHELAHFARRDHWANLFAVLTKTLFWWNPVTWWAHREIRAAQEACCDAIAIENAETSRQNYATTLLTALDFVQADGARRCTLALGMGTRRSVIRRFEMISTSKLSYKSSHWACLGIVVLITPLFCLPVRSQENTQSDAAILVDRSKRMDELTDESGKPANQQAEITDLGGTDKELYLIGIVWKHENAINVPEAWVTDRSTGKQFRLSKGTTFKSGRHQATFLSAERDRVVLRMILNLPDTTEPSPQLHCEWRLGVCLNEALSQKVHPAAVDPKTNAGASQRSIQGEVTGTGFSGEVQIELTQDPQVLILRGKEDDIRRLKEVFGKINSERTKPENAGGAAEDQPYLVAYRIAPQDPELVSSIIKTMMSEREDVRVAVDVKTQALIVLGQRRDHEAIEPLLTQLAATNPDATERARYIQMKFRFQPWQDVLEWYAKASGLSLATDKFPSGTFNFADSRRYTLSETLDVFNSVLLTKGYVLVVRNRLLFVIDLEDGVPAGLVPQVDLKDLHERGKFELINVVLPLGTRDPDQTRKEISSLLSVVGTSAVLPQSKQVVVTDRAEVVRNVVEVLGIE